MDNVVFHRFNIDPATHQVGYMWVKGPSIVAFKSRSVGGSVIIIEGGLDLVVTDSIEDIIRILSGAPPVETEKKVEE